MTGTTRLTPQMAARNAHVAAAIATAMAAKGLTVLDLNKRLKKPSTSTSAYDWLHGISAPGPAVRPALARALGLAEADLQSKINNRPSKGPKSMSDAVTQLSPVKALTVIPSAARSSSGPCSMAILSDGQARVQFELVLPFAKAMRLMNMIADGGYLEEGKT